MQASQPIRTTFANGINPFTGLRQKYGLPTHPKTAMKKTTKIAPVDVSKLEICDDPLPSHRALPDHKYDPIFDKLKYGQCVKTEVGRADKVAQALRTYLKRKQKSGAVKAMSDYGDGQGRVWLLPKP